MALLRKCLLGFTGMVAASGVAFAQSPGLPTKSELEGREPNPVVREFHQLELLPSLELAPPAPVPNLFTTEVNNGWHVFPGLLWETMLDRLTIPLGTVPMWE